MLVEHSPEVPEGDTIKEMVIANLQQEVEGLAKYIEVTVEDGAVTLVGPVESWVERDALLAAAQKTPGVRQVIDHTHLRGYRISW